MNTPLPRPVILRVGSTVALTIKGERILGSIVKVTSGRTPFKVETLDRGTFSCADTHLLSPVTEEEDQEFRGALFKRRVAIGEAFVLGAVVELTGPAAAKFGTGKYVVCVVPNDVGRTRVALLGGDGNRYLTVNVESLVLSSAN
jgi:hypothetical protein